MWYGCPLRLSFAIVVIVAFCMKCNGQHFEFTCDSFQGLSLSNSSIPNPSYLVLGTNDQKTIGLGNTIAFFPAAFYFAVFTKRRIVINDNSLLGQFCRTIHCGFPLISQMRLEQPELFSDYNIYHLRIVSAKDFRSIFDGRQPLHEEEILLTTTGIDAKSEWWMYFNQLMLCAARVSGCVVGDITCAERHAFQSLVHGPFSPLSSNQISYLMNHIRGLSAEAKKATLTALPRAYASRFDIAIHLRNQFTYFEKAPTIASSVDSNSSIPNAKVIVQEPEALEWLNSTDADELFQQIEKQTLEFSNRVNNQRNTTLQPVKVYLSADSDIVKQHLHARLWRQLPLGTRFQIVHVEGVPVHHVKHHILSTVSSSDETSTQLSDSFIATVFDWYALSLSNVVLAWRKGGSKGISTFVFSAAKVSGTRSKTDFEQGDSVGTQAFHFHHNRFGRLVLGRFWSFPNVEVAEKQKCS